jgi:RimJ/RimL family protein N-acetyltransferase
MNVTLRPLDEALVGDLLEVAVRTATPEETMPPVEGPPGWTEIRRQAFVEFYRGRLAGLDGPHSTAMFAVLTGGEVAGMIRLARTVTDGEYETGMFLGGTHRGRGLGAAALRAVLGEARRLGARAVIADTAPGNLAALATLRSCGAELTADQATGKILARIDVAGER